MNIKFLLVMAAALMLIGNENAAAASVENNQTQRNRVIHDESGRSIEIQITFRKHEDGSLTVMEIEPKKEAREFFDRACKEEFGSDAQWLDIYENKIRISSSANFTYSCHSR